MGVLLTFIPPYLKSVGITATELGVALGAIPAFAMVAPAFWGDVVDRTGKPGQVMTVIALGALLSLTPLVWVQGFWAVLACLMGYAFFGSSVTTVLDTIALRRVAQVGGSYSRLRLLGPAGSFVAVTSFGYAVSRTDQRAVYALLGLMSVFLLWSFWLHRPPSGAASAARRSKPAWNLLSGNPNLTLLLLGSCLHYVALGPFNTTLAIHYASLGHPPKVIGLAVGIGVLAETGVMLIYPQLARRLSPRALLLIAYAASAGRWAAVSVFSSAPALLLLSCLHGLTFGAFFPAIVGAVSSRVPDERRASGQALFVAFTFGLGGLLGFVGSGLVYQWIGGFRLFAVAAGVEVLALLVTLPVQPVAEPAKAQPSPSA